ncbi:MAG: methyltransferase family protein [Candidatus Hodarchaeota archaeon]
MLSYSVIGLSILLILFIYIIITLPLDILTYTKSSSSVEKNCAPSIQFNVVLLFVSLSTLYIWVLFILIPIDVILGLNFLYNPLFTDLEPFLSILQIIGVILLFAGTFVACWGRISRGKRAFSWGIPRKLETEGIFQYIRHPLYASYCYYFLGIVFILQSLIVFPILIGIYGYYEHSKYEEEILVNIFGQEYQDYQQKVGRFFPRFQR